MRIVYWFYRSIWFSCESNGNHYSCHFSLAAHEPTLPATTTLLLLFVFSIFLVSFYKACDCRLTNARAHTRLKHSFIEFLLLFYMHSTLFTGSAFCGAFICRFTLLHSLLTPPLAFMCPLVWCLFSLILNFIFYFCIETAKNLLIYNFFFEKKWKVSQSTLHKSALTIRNN